LILLWIFTVIHPKLLLGMLPERQQKEPRMDHKQLSMVADKVQWGFSEVLLNACGKDARFCRRQRTITPFRLGLALTATCASQHVDTLADCHRGFHAVLDTTMTYKAFSNQVAKPPFATFMGTMASRLIGEMTLKVLGFAQGWAVAEFRHMIMQDGSSFALHDAWREVFPGRFTTVQPAAVELPTTLDVLCDTPTTVVLTPDTASEQTFLPEPAALRDSLLLADRGYLDLHYRHRVQAASGFLIIRAKAGMNPQVVEAWREDGLRLRSLRNQPRKVIHAKRPQRQRVALVVLWQVEEHARRLRLLIRWNRRTKEFCSLLTNLPAQRYHLEMISRAYTWRWQVEVLFKEWNSYAHLHAVDTTNPAIVEGLLWTAIAAAALKRFLAYRTQRLAEVPMSTRKVAMCAMHVVGRIVQALKTGDGAGFYDALEEAITYLA
jgi:Transposase DDE domain